ncbi:MAG: c-type cytochrome biogenesis protein CcmI [Hyphomicrobiaceae bacterium]
MVLWVGLAAMAAAVVVLLLRPLVGSSHPDVAGTDAAAIYRAQLREIEADVERGVLEPSEAEAARTEIARRLLAASQGDAARHDRSSGSTRAVAFALATVVPIGALVIYLAIGTPGMPGQPFAGRVQSNAQQATLDQLVAKVEARLRQKPDDGMGWDVIGPVYLKQGRFEQAADAFARAISLLGETSRRLAGFAEATVMARDGVVNDDARRAYERLVVLEPQRLEPHFWLALAKEQDGKLADAVRAYEDLLARAPADAPWRGMVQERLAGVRKQAGLTAPAATSANAGPGARGPTAADVEAASRMSADERARMIEGMVQGLAERLKKDGRDVAGWERLIRAYTTLGRKETAIAALADARRSLAGEKEALARLDTLARSLGLGS